MADNDKKPSDEQTQRVSGFTNMVEVQFQRGTRMRVDAAAGSPCAFRSEEDAFSLDGLNAYLVEKGCMEAQLFDESPDIAETEHLALTEGIEAPQPSGLYILHFPREQDVRVIAKELRDYPGVDYASPLPFTTFASAPVTDPLVVPSRDEEFQWYIQRCKVDKAWDLDYTGKGVVIADIDSGFQIHHPELEGRFNLCRAFNAVKCNNELSESGDNLAHGTGVAGQAGAAADGKGMAGIAHNAELWPIEVSPIPSPDPGPIVDPLAWVRGIRKVIEFIRDDLKCGKVRRVVIIVEGQTLSCGNITQIGVIKNAILSAIAYGAVVCVPAGNGRREVSERDCDDYPTPCHGETFEPVGIIVGATDIEDQPFEGINPTVGTNFGEAIVVSAPGDARHDLTCSADLNSLFTPIFGATSAAAAKVAGAVALMLQANPELRHCDVEEIFRKTGKPITSLGRLLDCEAAVLMAKQLAPQAVSVAAD